MERPILFSTLMVQAILDGRKTMTRRVIKLPSYIKQQENGLYTLFADGDAYLDQHIEELVETGYLRCPYGKSGDILWVRETWAHEDAWYDDAPDMEWKNIHKDGKCTWVDYKATETQDEVEKWRPSIFMPRWACRIKLLIKDIRVERLQDMCVADCVHEGVDVGNAWTVNAKPAFIKLWDGINSKRGYGWDKNPWVWVVSFERI